MGLHDEIQIERTHRAGKAIVVRFLSCQKKMLILKNACRLNESDDFDNAYVKEDCLRTVRQK